MPLTPEEIRALICCRIGSAIGSKDYPLRVRIEGEIEGLLYALTGKRTSVAAISDAGELLDAAGIPHTRDGLGILAIPDDWLEAHDMKAVPDNRRVVHPKFAPQGV